jgi:hypothetical protein
MLEEASMKTSRICHSTGKIIVSEVKRAHGKARICRGSRNYQLQLLAGIGFLTAPTDEAWEKKNQEIQQQKGKSRRG